MVSACCETLIIPSEQRLIVTYINESIDYDV